jgi:hypothetical protein
MRAIRARLARWQQARAERAACELSEREDLAAFLHEHGLDVTVLDIPLS